MSSDLDNDLHLRWTTADLAVELRKDTRASDAQVLRVLAARLAAGSAEADAVLVGDLHAAFASLAETVRRIVDRETGPDGDAEGRGIVKAVNEAERAVCELTGWL